MTNTPKRLNVTTNMQRRQLLQLGVGLGALPLLNACGQSGLPPTVAVPAPPVPAPSPVPTPAPTPVPVPQTAVRGIHVSYTGDLASSRTLTWFTDGLENPGTVAEWGPVTAEMNAEQLTMAPFPMRTEGSASPAFDIEVLTHRVDLTDLPANTAIRYRVGDGNDFSSVRVFQPTPSGDFRFVHFGDSSTSAAAQEVMARTKASAPDFFIVAGDLAYANGTQEVWDTWFDQIDHLASHIPMVTCPGNHEAKDGGGLGYSSRVSQPDAETYYSFTYNRVHFCLSTAGCLLSEDPESVAALATELAWIEADLAEAALRRAAGSIDFIIFVQHYTIWTDSEGRDPGNLSLIALEEDILVRYGVDMVLAGHDHIYERSKPMAFGMALPVGYVQVTQGGGGQSLYSVVENPAAWSEIVTARHGYSEYAVSNGLISIKSWAVSDEEGSLLPEPELIDSFSIEKRLPTVAASFVQPQRSRKKLLKDFDAIVAHTRQRNALHDIAEMLHP